MDLLAVEIRQFPLCFVLKPKLSPEFKLQRSLRSVFSCVGTVATFRMDVECQFTPSVAPSLMYLFSFAFAGLICSLIHSFHDTREYPTFHLLRVYLKFFSLVAGPLFPFTSAEIVTPIKGNQEINEYLVLWNF